MIDYGYAIRSLLFPVVSFAMIGRMIRYDGL